MGKFTQLGCVSIAVNSLEEATRTYCDGLGLEPIGPIRNSVRGFGLRWQDLGHDGSVFLDLIEPTSPDSAVARFLEQRGEGVYQVRLCTPDLADAIRAMRSQNLRVIDDSDGHQGPALSWVHPASTHGVLLELQELAH